MVTAQKKLGVRRAKDFVHGLDFIKRGVVGIVG